MSIRVRVKLAGILKAQLAGRDPSGFDVCLADGNGVGALIAEIGIPADMVGMAVVNGERLEHPRALVDGDQVLLLPPLVAGG
jgi:molybdopterin converting factor small subunit